MQMNLLGEARTAQGVSLESISRFLGMTPRQIKALEDSSYDPRVSEIHKWQKALDIPISELISECECELSGPILSRAKMVRLMKTAISLREAEKMKSTLSQLLIDQILEIMPELSSMIGSEK